MFGVQLFKERGGGIALEAALLLPLFLAFVLGLISFIQLAVTEMALESAVSEATKIAATQMYPARLLLQEGKAGVEQTRAASAVGSAIDRVQSAREQVLTAEDFVEDYAAYIPDFVLEILRWEKEKRQLGEQVAGAEYERFLQNEVNPRIHAAFKPLLSEFGNDRILKTDRLRITSVLLPSMDTLDQPYFSMEAAYEFRLHVPFFRQTLTLRNKSYERCWIGA